MNVDLILEKLYEQHKKFVINTLKESIASREAIEKNDKRIEKDIIKKIIHSVYTANFNSNTAKIYVNKLRNLKLLDVKKLANVKLSYLEKIGMGKRKNRKIIKIFKEINNNNISVIQWVKNLEEGKIKKDLGQKSNDDFLKELGFFQHFPVDTLTARLFERTGLLKYGSIKYDTFINPLDNKSYYKLRNLMIKVFRESDFSVKINDKTLNTKNNIGFIDPMLWVHCTSNKKFSDDAICKDKPECWKCSIKTICEYKDKILKLN